MMIKYNGISAIQEFPYTGVNAQWQPGQTSDISDTTRINALLAANGWSKVVTEIQVFNSVAEIPSAQGVYQVGGQLFVVSNDGDIVNSSIKSSVGRKKLLVFGNSLALQNMTTLLQGTNFSTVSADARRGATSFTVASAGTAAIGNKVAIQTYCGQVFYSTITNVVTNTITIADKLPMAIKSAISCVVHWYTSDGVDDWVYQQLGPVYAACSMLGMPVDVIHGYGYGGAYAQMMLSDLERVLRITQPQFVVFNLFENDIGLLGSGAVATELDRLTRLMYLACELSISAGAVPIFLSPYPASSVGTTQEAELWDAMKTATLAINSVYAQAVAIDTSTPWLGTTTATTRPAATSWTDGVHPHVNKQVVIGKLIKNQLGAVIGTASSFKRRALQYIDMSGSSGSGTGAGYSSGPVSTGITLGITTNLSSTVTKTTADKQRVAATNTGAMTFGTHYVNFLTGTLPASETALGGQWIKGAARFTVNALQNIHRVQLILKFSPGNQTHKAYSGNNSGLGAFSEDGYFDGETFTLETGSVSVPNDATGYTLELKFEPETNATVGTTVCDVTVEEMGIVSGTSDLFTINF